MNSGPIDPRLQGGIELKKVPVISWEAYVACGLKVYHENKLKLVIFDPKPMVTVDEAFQVMRLIVSAQSPKPGPIKWSTVPAEVRQHFAFGEGEA